MKKYSQKPNYLNVADEGIKQYINKLFILNTSSNYLMTKKKSIETNYR